MAAANLTNAYLSKSILSNADLSKANLSEANLSASVLRGADLTEANLTGADVRGAVLDTTDLTEANLTGADLRWTALRDAKHLPEANLSQAKYNAKTQWPHDFKPEAAGAERIADEDAPNAAKPRSGGSA